MTGAMTLPKIPSGGTVGTKYPIGFDKGLGCRYFNTSATTFSWSGSTSGTLGAAWTINWTVNVSPVSDNGNGTWKMLVAVTATPSAGFTTSLVNYRGIINGANINLNYGFFMSLVAVECQLHASGGGTSMEYAGPNDYRAIVPGFPYFNCSTSMVDPTTAGTLKFTQWMPYYTYDCEGSYVLNALDRDNARYDYPANCVTMYLTRAVTLTGVVNYALLEWQAIVTGLTVGSTYTVYFHFDYRSYATPPWVSGTYELSVTFVADQTTVNTIWIGKQLFYQGFCQNSNPWPGVPLEFQLNSVDFTP
jgi:hypothetical protein